MSTEQHPSQDRPLDIDAIRSASQAAIDLLEGEIERLRARLADAEEAATAAHHKVARAWSAFSELRRLQQGGHLNVRVTNLVDSVEDALNGRPHVSTLVMVEDDTVYVTDGVTAATFTISEAYSVMQSLADGLPNGRRALGPIGGER